MKKNTAGERQRDAKRIMPNLPEDIIVDILLKAHAQSICRFKCVCKHWCELFKNPDFLNSRRLKHSTESENLICFSIKDCDADGFYMHITKSTSLDRIFEDEHCEHVKMDSPFEDMSLQIEIIGSCNGLILMRNIYSETQIWLWNPYTKELKEFFMPKFKFGPADYHNEKRSKCCVTHGVSYNCDTNDYNIVVAACYEMHYDRHCCKLMVYTSESNSWKTLPNTFPYEILSMYGMAEVVFVSGAFHWIARRYQSKKTCIVSFSIHDENFTEVTNTRQMDKLMDDRASRRKALGVLGGCLCILAYQRFHSILVWVKKDYNVTKSWTKLFILQIPEVAKDISYMKILWEFNSGEILFVTAKGSGDWNCCLVLYDPLSQQCKATKTKHMTREGWNIEAYVERSLVSLNSTNGYSGKKRPSCTQQGSRKSVRLAHKVQSIGGTGLAFGG